MIHAGRSSHEVQIDLLSQHWALNVTVASTLALLAVSLKCMFSIIGLTGWEEPSRAR